MASTVLAATFDVADPPRVARFWADLLRRDVVSTVDGLLVPGGGTQLGLRFAPARTGKTGPERVHLHLTSSSAADQASTVERALALGARHVDVGQRPDEGHVVLARPRRRRAVRHRAGQRLPGGLRAAGRDGVRGEPRRRGLLEPGAGLAPGLGPGRGDGGPAPARRDQGPGAGSPGRRGPPSAGSGWSSSPTTTSSARSTAWSRSGRRARPPTTTAWSRWSTRTGTSSGCAAVGDGRAGDGRAAVIWRSDCVQVGRARWTRDEHPGPRDTRPAQLDRGGRARARPPRRPAAPGRRAGDAPHAAHRAPRRVGPRPRRRDRRRDGGRAASGTASATPARPSPAG